MFRKQHPVAGARPGTLQVPHDSPNTRVQILSYSKAEVCEQTLHDIDELDQYIRSDALNWIDVQGFRDVDTLRAIGEKYGVHPLALEAVVNVPQRPNIESFPEQLLVIARLLELRDAGELHIAQLGLILGPNYVLTFQDQYSNHLDPVRHRINLPTSRLRSQGADYLAYAIVDTVVDASYPVLESLGEQIESLEKRLIVDPRPHHIREITTLKNCLLNLRRTIWAQREAIHKLQVEEPELIGDGVKTFLRDTYDHCVQTADVVEMYREMSSGLVNTYTSSVAHRSNEIMKVLTIVSTIFVPLTFMAGIYGMNFDNMPELNFPWSYPLLIIAMVAIASGLLTFFNRLGWLRVSPIVDPDAPAAGTAPEKDQIKLSPLVETPSPQRRSAA